MSYGRILKGTAGSLLKASPIGGAIGKAKKVISSLFGGGTPGWSKSLRETKAAARTGDTAVLQHKLANSKYWQVRKAANQALLRMEGSQSIGAAPSGIMAAGGGVGRPVIRRKSLASAPRKRRRTTTTTRRRRKSRLKFGSPAWRRKFMKRGKARRRAA